ncbi:uncharacterized protein [Battus philenor]|uniref:uncharacterized protein n=1 Tax=Battus philenor TaxID=42288 RepID=UPI0035D03971
MIYLKLILFVFVFSIEGRILPRNPLEENILSFLAEWQGASNQPGSFPIPSLKTVIIPPVAYYYDGKGVKLNYSIGEMQLTGLDNFTVENIFASETSLDVTLSLRFPVLSLYSEKYKLKGRAYFIYPLRGSGKMHLTLRDVFITASVRFGANGNSTKVENFLLNFDVNKIEANLENSSWPINVILNTEGVQILSEYHGTIVDALWNYVVPMVNDYLKDIPTAELLQTANTLPLLNAS